MRHLADRLARRRGEVVAVLAVDRRHPMPTDEVLVALFDLHGAARLAWGLECRGLLGGCHDPLSPVVVLSHAHRPGVGTTPTRSQGKAGTPAIGALSRKRCVLLRSGV